MKRVLIALSAGGALLAFVAAAAADDYVNGYYRKDGTYVEPYHRSTPNGNPYDNYSTRGNVNPYTGQEGTHAPTEDSPSNPYAPTFPQTPNPSDPY